MKIRGEQLYQTMLADIIYCKQRGLDPVIETELCFEISNKYWAILRNNVGKHEFETEDEEIHFFKELKPLFISQIEYYGLVYHAQLFKKDVKDHSVLQKFWLRESQRLKGFIDENSEFYHYYKNGESEVDRIWFIRANNDLRKFLTVGPDDLDIKTTTSHDHLVGRLLALEKYQEYINGKLKDEVL